LTTLQIARSLDQKFHFRSFLLDYRTALRRGASAAVLAALLPAFCAINIHAQKEQTVHIAAASDLQPVLPLLAAEYEHRTGVKIIASYGSSATLTQMIINGLPTDIFLSADTVHPQELVKADLATDLVPYAHGSLVLWARKDSPVQPLSLTSLSSEKLQKLAVANDLHAPYGLAATQALKTLGLYDRLKPKFVVGENISQTAQFALTGNAQAALISLTIASSPAFRSAGSFFTLPKSYEDIQQSAVILSASQNRGPAISFLAWLTSRPVQLRLPQFGLEPARRANDAP
jgi:molybdate transport system substrate-binding protein